MIRDNTRDILSEAHVSAWIKTNEETINFKGNIHQEIYNTKNLATVEVDEYKTLTDWSMYVCMYACKLCIFIDCKLHFKKLHAYTIHVLNNLIHNI